MAKKKYPSVSSLMPKVKKGEFLPIYFLFGGDGYTIAKFITSLEETFKPILVSEFDKSVLYGANTTIEEILDTSQMFPFGSEKKLVIVKEFDKVQKFDEHLKNYIKSPADFSVLVLVFSGTPSSFNKAYLKALDTAGFLFEAKELKEHDLADWTIEQVSAKGKIISHANAQYLVTLIGDDRYMLEMQIEKMVVYAKEEQEITFEMIKAHAAITKAYTVFDLQDALAIKDAAKTFKVGYRLLDQGENLIMILSMLNKYFTGLLQIPELQKSRKSDQEAARIVGTHPFYYKNHVRAKQRYSDKDLHRIAKAIFNADLAIKSSNTDDKTILTLLFEQIFE